MLVPAAFCAAEKKEVKKPEVAVSGEGCVRVPPGVLSSSAVGVRGALVEVESLLGSFADCALRCLMLSMELGRGLGELLVGELGPRKEVSVGVGGVTTVVGVSWRFGGVAGSVVLMNCCGVSGRSRFASGTVAIATGVVSSTFCGALGEASTRLFLRLDDLNKPPRLPIEPLPPFNESVSADFFLVRANRPRSRSDDDGLRPGSSSVGKPSDDERCSTMAGMFAKGSCTVTASGEVTMPSLSIEDFVCVLISGDERVI